MSRRVSFRLQFQEVQAIDLGSIGSGMRWKSKDMWQAGIRRKYYKKGPRQDIVPKDTCKFLQRPLHLPSPYSDVIIMRCHSTEVLGNQDPDIQVSRDYFTCQHSWSNVPPTAPAHSRNLVGSVVCVRVRGWVSSTIFPPYLLRQGFSLKLESPGRGLA